MTQIAKYVADQGIAKTLGSGRHRSRIDGRVSKVYSAWGKMFARCYSPQVQEKKPSYIGCSVHPEFHNFQNFAAWAEEQSGSSLLGWELDKDILIKGNKVYGPSTCVFVPREINLLFSRQRSTRGTLPIGVAYDRNRYVAWLGNQDKRLHLGRHMTVELAFKAYKDRKELLIKEAAEQWRHILSEKAYVALMAYQVEITD